MDRIEDNGLLLAIVWREDDWRPGLHFCTPVGLFIQAGCWQYPAGKDLGNHRHKVSPRPGGKTQEVVYVKRGSMKARILAADGRIVKEVVLKAGDFAVMAEGGHGYEILEDGSQILEVKNGPFVDAAADKEPL